MQNAWQRARIAKECGSIVSRDTRHNQRGEDTQHLLKILGHDLHDKVWNAQTM